VPSFEQKPTQLVSIACIKRAEEAQRARVVGMVLAKQHSKRRYSPK